ncbi:hypothetical protein J3E71DRAFT_359273 [Bipolaris maydis]|nr:hypothetical protein J3E71DRAFT_359273 [Bipolaris maydis]
MYRTAMWSRRTCMGWSNGRGNRGAWAAGNCPLGHRGAHSARDDLSSGLGALGRPVAAGRRSRLHMCPALSGALMQATAPHPIVRLHRTAPHHARGDEGGGDARRVVPLLAEIWSIRRPPAMLAGGSSAFGPLGLLHAAHSSLSLPRVVKAGVGVGAGRGSGRRCGCGRRGSGDNDGWVGECVRACAGVRLSQPGVVGWVNGALHGRRAANQRHAARSQAMESNAAARQRSLTLAKHPCTTDSRPLSDYS